jgi:hypothetical protein
MTMRALTAALLVAAGVGFGPPCDAATRGTGRRRVERLARLVQADRHPSEREPPSEEGAPTPDPGPSVRRFWTSRVRKGNSMTVKCESEADTTREPAMTAAQFELIDESEAHAILRWRFDVLIGAGYDIASALVLASHVEIDLHVASALTRRGCAAETALRILL